MLDLLMFCIEAALFPVAQSQISLPSGKQQSTSFRSRRLIHRALQQTAELSRS